MSQGESKTIKKKKMRRLVGGILADQNEFFILLVRRTRGAGRLGCALFGNGNGQRKKRKF